MRISELPDDIKEIALKRQKEQGNEPNEALRLSAAKSAGNFCWDSTWEGYKIWDKVDDGDFEDFYDYHGITEQA